MSYCRFQNTYTDLLDCFENLDSDKKLSEEEEYAKNELIELCKIIANKNNH